MKMESSNVVGIDPGPLLKGQIRIANHKSAYKSLIVGPRGLQCATNFDLGLLQGQMTIAKHKVLITHLLLVLEVCERGVCKKNIGNHGLGVF